MCQLVLPGVCTGLEFRKLLTPPPPPCPSPPTQGGGGGCCQMMVPPTPGGYGHHTTVTGILVYPTKNSRQILNTPSLEAHVRNTAQKCSWIYLLVCMRLFMLHGLVCSAYHGPRPTPLKHFPQITLIFTV